MSTTQQPEALRLAVSSSAMADEGEMIHLISWHEIRNLLRADATELRRLHAECETLRTGYSAARLEIESLQNKLKAVDAFGPSCVRALNTMVEHAGEYPVLPSHGHASDGASGAVGYSADQMRAYGEACWKAGYKHGAWADAKPAGAQVETAYGATEFGWTDWRDLQDGDKRLKALVVSLFGNDHQAFADLEALIDRASHGQAPAQAAPATDLAQLRHLYTNLKNGGVRDTAQAKRIADGLLGPVIESLERAQAAPAAPPVPSGWSFDVKRSDGRVWLTISTPHGASATLSAAEKTGNGDDTIVAQVLDYLADSLAVPAAVAGPSGPSITLDFKMASELLDMFGGEPGLVTLQHGGEKCHSGVGLYAWYSDLPEEGAGFLGAEPDDEAAPTTQPAPQQEAQEPVAWYVTGCGRLLDEDEAKAEARHIGGTARAIPLYTAPQPSPASQGDALDAARYRWLRGNWFTMSSNYQGCITFKVGEPRWSHITETDLDAAIDAARAAQEGK